MLYENWISDVFVDKDCHCLSLAQFKRNATEHGSWVFDANEIRRRFAHAVKNPIEMELS